MKLLLTNIKELLQVRETAPELVSGIEMKELPTIKNAWLLLEDGLIHSFGKMKDVEELSEVKTIDCTGKIVLPTWCDSHTHLVYAGNREQEFVDRINGHTYQEIAESGGG
ncbi:MAG: imidazolonepropionase, partial [Flavobacteriaceae bacterium]